MNEEVHLDKLLRAASFDADTLALWWRLARKHESAMDAEAQTAARALVVRLGDVMRGLEEMASADVARWPNTRAGERVAWDLLCARCAAADLQRALDRMGGPRAQ